MLRSSNVSGPESETEVAVIGEMQVPATMRNLPTVSNMNVHKSSVHVGHKFVNVTQNVENKELVKELPFHQYMWNIVKNTTRAERLSCAVAVLVLILCTGLILYFTVVTNKGNIKVIDKAPHEWNITLDMWLARESSGNSTIEEFSPVKLVIIQHTVSPECHKFATCAAEMRSLQDYFLDKLGYNLPYNFVIGNDGRVYRVRGWNREGAHTKGYNRCSVGIAFIGDYREDFNVHTRVTELQLQRLHMILQEGVDRGFLRPDYSIIGANDVTQTESPGTNLYKALQKLDHYDTRSYRNMNCTQIQAMITADD